MSCASLQAVGRWGSGLMLKRSSPHRPAAFRSTSVMVFENS